VADSLKHRAWMAAVAVLGVALVAAGCSLGGDDDEGGSQPETAACGYLYEWLHAWRFPLQPDPHAAYSYVISKVTTEPIGYVISGAFPYAAWTSWDVYNARFQPFAVAEDSTIKPDEGGANPFVVGTPVLSEKRGFKLLVVPKGTDDRKLASSLQGIPASNRLATPTSGKFFVIANRVYNAFPGYNLGGAAGPTNTPFPEVKAVNYETGEGVDCSQHNLLPSPKPPTETPAAPSRSPSPLAIELTDGTRVSIAPEGGPSDGQASQTGLRGAQFAPELDPDRIEMTRLPLLPGADVSSIPPPDNCAGYLGAATSTTRIGLIRMPHVATWFNTKNLTTNTKFTQEQADFISFDQYGNGVGIYEPGSPNSGSLGNEELLVDSSGGATIVVWPRTLSASERRQVFAYADQNRWALLRGGDTGPVTTANLLVRLKGASSSYSGAYTPASGRKGVPCYFDDHPKAKRWSDVSGDKYVASGDNIGPGAPQGVNCTVGEFVGGSCLENLKAYIAQTGGSYTAR
jgi:hypothetical protein